MRVAIIGLGFRLGYLGHVFREMDPDFEIVGYYDPAPAGMATLTEHGIPAGIPHESPEALVKAGGFDLLMIGSPNHFHLHHIRLGLEAGVKVFSEKPLVSSLEDTYALAALLARYGHENLSVGLVLRYAPLYRDLLAARDAGTLGNIVSVEAAEHIYPYHGAFFMRDWRRYEKWSGSFMLEKCCHDLDLYNGLIQARPERVASFGAGRPLSRRMTRALMGLTTWICSTKSPRAGTGRTRSSIPMAISSTIRWPSWNTPMAWG
ncbi:Gfo/Idh/MocA family oxidoreductase [Gemmobacter sp. 24YEA27]|uniref:Gfo/Idh/MocA family protein n=1 Tax=Gemmobacter sp. 24YEA27 TaxID=3040672 RepID=UPI0024B380AA|nr:Gfo/Idh/MocA family oxidoreductase [Gemmobacter sp. 24YEA27]